MKTIFAGAILACSINMNAQIYDWAISTTNTSNWIYAQSSTHLPNNQSVIAGHMVGFASGDFDPGSGSQVLTNNSANGAFVASYDYHGNYLWAFELDGNGTGVYLNDIASDPAGNIYITGFLSNVTNVDFDPGPGTALLSSFPNASDYIYLASYDNLGNYRWAFMLGAAPQAGRAHALTVTPAGEIVVVGYYVPNGNTFDFDPGPASSGTNSNYGFYGFIAWYNTGGNFVRANTIEGTGSAQPQIYDVSTDNIGSIYIAGSIPATNPSTVDFDPSAAVYNVNTINNTTAFVARYYPNGNFGWVNSVTGGGGVIGRRVSSDNSGSVYFAFNFGGPVDDVDPGGPVVPYYSGSSDGATCLVKYVANTGAYLWSFQVENTTVGSLVADNFGDVYLCGRITITQTATPDLDPGPAVVSPAFTLGMYVSRYTSAGIFHSWIEITNSGNGNSFATHLDATSTGELYLSGYYDITLDFDPSSATHTLPVSGNDNMFLVRYVTHATGIDDPDSGQINIYPNPVSTVLNITGDHAGEKLTVHSMLGEIVYSTLIQNSSAQIDVSNFAPGVYVGELIDENGFRSVFQFVKQ